MLPASEVDYVYWWAPGAKEGDLLVTAGCDQEESERLLNQIRRDTR